MEPTRKRRKRILLVDDEVRNLELLEACLEALGHEMVRAGGHVCISVENDLRSELLVTSTGERVPEEAAHGLRAKGPGASPHHTFGSGLHFCKLVMAAHRGEVALRSMDSSTISFVLSFAAAG